MTSQTSSSETDQQREIDELKARIIALEALVAGLQQWQLRVPTMPAAGAAQPYAPVVYPGTAPGSFTIPYPVNVCQGAAGVPQTYIVTTP